MHNIWQLGQLKWGYSSTMIGVAKQLCKCQQKNTQENQINPQFRETHKLRFRLS